jgi:two-component system, sensor histidine kinase and response regulator
MVPGEKTPDKKDRGSLSMSQTKDNNTERNSSLDIAPALILAVDDQPENLMVFEADLEDAGYRVKLAENGPAALKKIDEQRPDLVLLDVSMPGLDGYEVCRRIRSREDTRDLPVIMVTGRDSVEDIVEGLDAGAYDYITKPIEPRILLARIRTQLRVKQLQDALKKSIQELEHLQQLRSDFVAMITHDMKAPLTSIVGLSGMLMEEEPGALPTEEFRESLGNINTNGRKLTQLINDFLTFSRIEAGKLEFHFEPIDLNLCIMQAVSLFKYQAEKKNIRIQYNPRSEAPDILGDDAQIERALGNLLSNAIKYSQAGQTVGVELTLIGDWLQVEIRDEGPGIEPDLLPRLFDRYFRVRSPKKTEGTGLGLSIVKSVADAHGGSVVVETAPGQGSLFVRRFPVWKSTKGEEK